MPRDPFLTRVLVLSVAVALAAEALVDRHALGINVPIVVAVLLASAWLMRPGSRRLDPLDAWLPVATLVVAAFVAIRDDRALVLLDAMGATVLCGASLGAFAGASVTRRTLAAGLVLAAQVVSAAALGSLTIVERVRAVAPVRAIVSRSLPRLAPVGRGLLIGLPLAAVFAILFAAADPIFGSLWGRVLGVDLQLGDLPARLAFTLATAWVAGGLLWLVGTGDVSFEARSLGAAARAPAVPLPRLGATEALTVLVALDLVFGTFVALQLAYLFGGLDTLAASGVTYANYARRGFFELLAVGFLAGGLIATVEATVSDRPRGYVAALLSLVALSGAVLASSFLRLRLYQDAYGWTELRFYVLASIAFLAVAFGAAAFLIVRNQSRWLPNAVGAAGLIVFLAINVVGPQAYVTDQNLARALNPALVPPDGRTTLDTAYLGSLDADSIPAMVAALPFLPASARAEVLDQLRDAAVSLDHVAAANDLPAWNLARERARAALASR
jgi:Domain of unknown function (DUF4173)